MKIYIGVDVISNTACAIWDWLGCRKSVTFRDNQLCRFKKFLSRKNVEFYAYVVEPSPPSGFVLGAQASFRLGLWYGVLHSNGVQVKVLTSTEFVDGCSALTIATQCKWDFEKEATSSSAASATD